MIYKQIHLKDRFAFLGENDRHPNLTVYLPDTPAGMGREEQKRPCLLICPGGGYGHCSDREAEPIAFHFLTQGYNVFVLRYSVAPNRYPVQLLEAAAAMEILWENAEDWHCDTSRVAIMGFSAGGHLAAHYSNCYNCPEVRQIFAHSKPVQASVLCYPVISAEANVAHFGSFRNLLGVPQLTQAQIEAFSCDRLVTKNTPPAFIWHTVTDNVVPVANSLRYASALAEQSIPFSLHIYPAGSHGLATVDEQTNGPLPEQVRYAADWLSAAQKWLAMTL